MKTLIIDKPDISIDLKNSGVSVNDQHIPFRLIDMLIVTQDITINTKTILSITKENIPILIISKNSRNFSLTLPVESKNSEIKMQQYASINNRLGFAKYFLFEKFKTHYAHLQLLGVNEDIQMWSAKIDEANSIAQLLGIEGSFSKMYFKHYFASLPKVMHKGKRSKRPPADPINAVLSYIYTYTYHIITSKLYQAGLDPALSYLHEPFRSHNGLSSDMIELYRARVNEMVATWFNDKVLTSDDFSKKDGVYLKYDGRKKLWEDIQSFTSNISLQLDKEIALLKVAIL